MTREPAPIPSLVAQSGPGTTGDSLAVGDARVVEVVVDLVGHVDVGKG
jgi:hypothetical protein